MGPKGTQALGTPSSRPGMWKLVNKCHPEPVPRLRGQALGDPFMPTPSTEGR